MHGITKWKWPFHVYLHIKLGLHSQQAAKLMHLNTHNYGVHNFKRGNIICHIYAPHLPLTCAGLNIWLSQFMIILNLKILCHYQWYCISKLASWKLLLRQHGRSDWNNFWSYMPKKTEVAEPNLARFPAETAPNYRSANASPEQDTTQNINLLN